MPATEHTLRAAVIQMNSQHDCHENLDQAMALMADAAAKGAQWLVLPENFLCFGQSGLARLLESREQLVGQLQAFASARRVTIVAGSIAHPGPEDSGRFYSRSLLIDAEGQVQASYDKCHLFDVDVEDGFGRYRESDTYQPGQSAVVSDLDGVCLGMSICYDLRFANLYQALVEAGAQVITVPSAFTAVTGQAHWDVLLRARAIETQCYVLAANQCGDHGKGRQTWGHSMIVDPWGEVIARCDDGPGFCIAELDFQRLADIRKALPVQKHRKRF